MPPRKPQIKGTKKKKSESKCKYNNRGYCKLKEACENIHNDKICLKECFFYLHVTIASSDENIETLKKNFNSK